MASQSRRLRDPITGRFLSQEPVSGPENDPHSDNKDIIDQEEEEQQTPKTIEYVSRFANTFALPTPSTQKGKEPMARPNPFYGDDDATDQPATLTTEGLLRRENVNLGEKIATIEERNVSLKEKIV